MVNTGNSILKFSLFLLIVASFLSCSVELPEAVKKEYATIPDNLDFNIHVKPILSDKCYFCHGPDKAVIKGGLQLDSQESASVVLSESGNRAIVPYNAAKSALTHRVLSEDPELMMPPPESNLALSDRERAILIKWIEEGAEYKDHWSFLKPEKTESPKVDVPVVNGIDNFVFAKLGLNKLNPSKEADKETLIRRVSFDLTGLPPTLDEIEEFLQDESPNAYELLVDRLLTTPQYGEKMAVGWLDLARYADTHGYTVDRYRPTWRWREWVIKSFNENMPYDKFVTWQLAGDLLPNPTKEQLLATGFNRNHSQNMEGGIINEEFRVEYVADRTITFGKAFLGLTLECARCHDHKYDPVSQKEFYQLFSIFNQVDDAGQISWDNATPVPTILWATKEEDSSINTLKAEIEGKKLAISKVKGTGVTPKIIEKNEALTDGLIAYFDFESVDNNEFVNKVNRSERAKIMLSQRRNDEALAPDLVVGKTGSALKSNGDDPLDMGSIGAFSRSEPFTVATWVKVPNNLENGVIFHKGQGAIIYDFRGYHLAIRDNKLEALMAHTWPYNNIVKISESEVPKDGWIHVALVYDGSSKANGLHVFLNGEPITLITEKDNLYKDILFRGKKQTGLRFGARWRGTGTKNALFDDINVYNRKLQNVEIKWLFNDAYKASEKEENELAAYHNNEKRKILEEELIVLRKKKNEIVEFVEEVMVMDELETWRPTYILERGEYDAYGEEVFPGTPVSLLELPNSLPKNRLGLAKWLFLKENSITARVAVNRYWQLYFGTGLVKTSDDFGSQGEMPSHPELLDWLANQFVESDWDIKALQKLIVMSATYRQDSKADKQQLAIDYDNRLLSRGPSSRLSAEMMRDNALFTSGLLKDKIGGESVKPYQPKDLWRVGGQTYRQDHGEKLYRRSLYTYWKRTVPPPSMNIFDAPSRSYCLVKRQNTSTPLQALVLMNDPQFIEACRVLSEKTMLQRENDENRLLDIFTLLTSRKPQPNELKLIKEFYNKQLSDFKINPEKTESWLTIGEQGYNKNLDEITLAAMTVTASMVMNSDAAVMKR